MQSCRARQRITPDKHEVRDFINFSKSNYTVLEPPLPPPPSIDDKRLQALFSANPTAITPGLEATCPGFNRSPALDAERRARSSADKRQLITKRSRRWRLRKAITMRV